MYNNTHRIHYAQYTPIYLTQHGSLSRISKLERRDSDIYILKEREKCIA